MAEHLIIAHYSRESEDKPEICYRTKTLKDAEANFLRIAEKKCKSVVLYDMEQDEVLKVAIQGEPIYLVRAVELVRSYADAAVRFTVNKGAKAAAGIAIGKIIAALSEESIPGEGGVIVAQFLGPYYVFKASFWGGLFGTLLWTAVAGPIGGVLGASAGGKAFGPGAGPLVKSLTHPNKCDNCKGTGLVDDFRTCQTCKGYGYLK